MPQGMTWTFTEQLRYLVETGLIDGKDVKYTNQTLINGFLFSKPREKVINENTGKRVMTFYLLQIHQFHSEVYLIHESYLFPLLYQYNYHVHL